MKVFLMTRINLIPVNELSDQHLIAEYRELPRVLKQDIDIKDAPYRFVLGKGHCKWAKSHSFYILNRYKELLNEMKYRGFKTNYSYDDLVGLCDKDDNYKPNYNEIFISRCRISERICMKPEWYKWTKREIPEWVLWDLWMMNLKRVHKNLEIYAYA